MINNTDEPEIGNIQDSEIVSMMEEPYSNIFGKNKKDQIICVYCKAVVEQTKLSNHMADHLSTMFRQTGESTQKQQNDIKKIWNYQETVIVEKQLLEQYNKDYRLIYKGLKKHFLTLLLDCGIFAQYQRNQNLEYTETLRKMFYYLFVNQVEIIRGEDIVNFVKEEKNVNVNALQQYARQEQIKISEEQLNAIREIGFQNVQDVGKNQEKFKENQDYQNHIYTFITDMINSNQKDTALVMNLQLSLKISQDDIFQLNYSNIRKDGINCIISLPNQTQLTLNREHLLPELQKVFWDSIGINQSVIKRCISNKRNYINKSFNSTRKFLMNTLGNSENDKNYRVFLQQVSLKNYKKMPKASLKVFNIVDDALEKMKQQNVKKGKIRENCDCRYDQVIKKLIYVDSDENDVDKKIYIKKIDKKVNKEHHKRSK